MTIKNFNAKKMLMSTLAAVVFSFAFTTSANAASPQAPTPQKSNVGIRVKGTAPKSNLGVRVKGTAPKGNVEIRVKDEPSTFEKFMDQILGIRVKIRVK
jgi:hypothetical protein